MRSGTYFEIQSEGEDGSNEVVRAKNEATAPHSAPDNVPRTRVISSKVIEESIEVPTKNVPTSNSRCHTPEPSAPAAAPRAENRAGNEPAAVSAWE